MDQPVFLSPCLWNEELVATELLTARDQQPNCIAVRAPPLLSISCKPLCFLSGAPCKSPGATECAGAEKPGSILQRRCAGLIGLSLAQGCPVPGPCAGERCARLHRGRYGPYPQGRSDPRWGLSSRGACGIVPSACLPFLRLQPGDGLHTEEPPGAPKPRIYLC